VWLPFRSNLVFFSLADAVHVLNAKTLRCKDAKQRTDWEELRYLANVRGIDPFVYHLIAFQPFDLGSYRAC
jgi:hypothetical protein